MVTPQMNPFEIPEDKLKYGKGVIQFESKLSEELLTLILNPYYFGGERGIRTPGSNIIGTRAFQARLLNRSSISP